MFNSIKYLFLLFLIGMASEKSCVAQEQIKFRYEYTEIIIHFTPDGQVYNGRPDDAYNPQHYFNLFYDILIRYVYPMEPFGPGFSINDIGVWHEMHLINKFNSQALYIGDRILSDGNSWVILSEPDYMKIQELIKDIKERDKQPITTDKEKLISDLIYTVDATSNGESYTENFKKYESIDSGVATNKEESGAPRRESLDNQPADNPLGKKPDSSSISSSTPIGISSAKSHSASSYKDSIEINHNSLNGELKEINQEAKNSSDKTTFKTRIKFIILILVVLIGIALFILFRKKKSG